MPQDYDREMIGFLIGTQLGTILYVPVNFTGLIYGFKYVNPSTAAGTVVAQMLSQKLGTLTGTIDVVSVETGVPERDSIGERPIAIINAGEYLVGQVITPQPGSIEGALIYAYVPGRLSPD